MYNIDDSGSMAWETDIDDVDRKSAQAALVRRIAGIATRAAPKEGVHLRFINQNTAYDDLDPAEIEAKMQFVPKGRTPLGENLRRKVLQPLVYDIVESGKRLTRPLLILTITDGYPDTPNTFQDEIRKCGRYLIQNGYQKAAVRFDLSQIGNDQHAASFLESLSHDEEISDVLYVTAGHLDGTFAKLRDNEQKLEEWLLGKLSNPVRTV
ncbi:hypothetical protein F4860DRAFT_392205 [Xylaria cubensis]|nr:hypothetical protein F4860DRAFT_392205 [Xylaria cubensis]